MAQLVTVRPKPGSRLFKARGTMTQYNKVSGGIDSNEVRATGEFKGQRFPNSRQIIRPKWSFSRRIWMLAGASRNSDKLNEIVSKCKLKYEEGHPKHNQYITSADIFDREDPFFTHSRVKVIAREGEFVLDKENPLDMILIMSIQGSPEFKLYNEESDNVISSRVNYIITDKNIENIERKRMRKKEMEAMELYTNMSPEKKLKVAIAMGIVASEHTDPDVVDEALYKAVHSTKQSKKGITTQDYFIAMCNATSVEIETRYLINRARAKGHLKKTRNDGWTLFGNSVGMNDTEVYKWFKNTENQDLIFRLEEVLEKDHTPITAVGVKSEQALVNLDHEEKEEVSDVPEVVQKKTRRKKKEDNDE